VDREKKEKKNPIEGRLGKRHGKKGPAPKENVLSPEHQIGKGVKPLFQEPKKEKEHHRETATKGEKLAELIESHLILGSKLG